MLVDFMKTGCLGLIMCIAPLLTMQRIPPPLLTSFSGHDSGVMALAFTKGGKTLVTGGEDKTVRFWSIASKKNVGVLLGHQGPVNSVSASPDGRVVASASDDKTIILWEVFSRKQRAVLRGHVDSVYVVAYSPDCKIVASASADKTIRLWDTLKGTQIAVMHVPDWELDFQGIFSLVFSPNGKILASVGLLGHTIRLWDVSKAACIRVISDPGLSIISVAFDPTGKILMAAAQDCAIKLRNVDSGEVVLCHRDNGTLGLAFFSPDGATIISGHPGGSIVFSDAKSGKMKSFFEAHERFVYAAVCSPDGTILATCDCTKTVRQRKGTS